MRLKTGFTLRPLGEEFILLAEGTEVVNFNKMLTLNESAAYLYQRVEASGREFTPETLASFLQEEYEVSPEQALADATLLAEKWLQAGISERQ